ncbi:MAG: hypothetical protein HC866_11210 [Leptolyngbyaceae cyanobacterium RU_5_1]|nr:hypothetical protein [Leptolyngbyaceae cyanobacterium RU_5_1]
MTDTQLTTTLGIQFSNQTKQAIAPAHPNSAPPSSLVVLNLCAGKRN